MRENESAISAQPRSEGTPVSTSSPQGNSSDEDLSRDPVEVLAAEFVDRHRSGECPSIEEYALKYPDLAEEIRDLFPMIASLENLKLQRERSSGGVASTGLPCLKKLGDFRIIGEIGRGGMGIVYEAEQLSLRRLVALKVLGAQIANSVRQLKRFRREAEAAARLHHTNIVPIFAIGEEDSIHYYAMQFINGPTLAELVEHEAIKAGISVPRSPASQAHKTSAQAQDVVITETVIDRSSSATPQSLRPVVVEYQAPAGDGRPPKLFVGVESTGRHARVIENFHHEDFRAMARIGVQLADALAYAHDQGVLHRDIKPANILIDADGISWLADFGLAKHEDHEGVTHSGDIVGTLRFMAPEQFHGQCDVRSDIYSLGLTLYEVLTLKPAFQESRYAPLVQQKTTQAPPSPRSLNPRIPLDLETIILKACAPEPQHRYESARELRDDLQRFVEDMPIQARRLTVVEQFWRWARRNPVVASLSAVTTTLLLMLATVLAVGQYRAQKALAKIEEARSKAEQSLRVADVEAARAAANLNLALTALDQIIQNIASRGVPQSLNMELEGNDAEAIPFTTVTSADAALLENMVQFFNRFAEQNAANLQSETASALIRIGDIRDRLGQPTEAEAAYRKALNILTGMQQSGPPASALQLRIAEVWNMVGVASSLGGDFIKASEAHDSARRILLNLLDSGGDDVKFALAQTYNLLNTTMVRSGTTELMSPPPGSPPGVSGGPPQGPPPGDRRGDGSRDSGRDRGTVEDRTRRSGDGGRGNRPRRFPFDVDEAFTTAVSLLRELIQKHPDREKYRIALARSFRNRTRIMVWGNAEAMHEAEYAGLESIEILEQLVSEDPANPSYQFELADTYCLVAQQLREYPVEDRYKWLNSAIRVLTSLEARYPVVPEYQALMANAERGLGKLDREQQNLEESQNHFQRAATILEQLVHRYPSIRLYLFSHAQTLSEWAALEQQRGDRSNAQQKLMTAIAAIEKSLKPGVEHRGHQMFLGRLQMQLSYYRGEWPEPGGFGDFGRGSGGPRRPPPPEVPVPVNPASLNP